MWMKTSEHLPPEGKKVRTISAGGMESVLTRVGNLYFCDDGMYVYYEVVMWKPI